MESIQIGVGVTVLEIRPNRVRFGIDARENIDVRRTELQGQSSEALEKSARARVTPKAAHDSCGIEAWETEGGAVVSCVNVEPCSHNTAPPCDFKKE